MLERWIMRLGVLLIGLVILALSACRLPRTVKIAFIAPLTGRSSSLGIEGRNGFELALKQIHGQDYNLVPVYFDDKADQAVSLELTKQALDQSFDIFIFHSTSQASVASINLVNEHKKLALSATVAATELSNKDDFFLRTTASIDTFAQALGARLYEQHKNKKTFVLADLANKNYAQTFIQELEKLYQTFPKLLEIVWFDSKEDYSASAVSKQIAQSNAEVLLLIADPLNAALLCQNLAKESFAASIYLAPWAASNVFIQNAAASAEGVKGYFPLNPNSKNETYLQFVKDYQEQYKQAPEYFAALGYEGAWFLLQALAQKNDSSPQGLKSAMLNHNYEGLQGPLFLNVFGDFDNAPRLFTVNQAKFVED